MMSFEERLLEIRKSRSMSQEVLAEKIGVSRQAVSKWETGEAQPDYAKLIALADALDVSLDYLCGRESRAEPVPAAVAESTKKRQKVWVTVVAIVAVLIVAVVGLWVVKQTDVAAAEESKVLRSNDTEGDPAMVSGITFQCFDGEGVSFQFIPRIIGVQYTYIISFAAGGKEKSFVVPLDGNVCRGTVDLGPAGEDYTVILKMRYLADEYVEVVATNFHWNVEERSIGWMPA